MQGDFPWEPLLELLHRNDVVCRGILGEKVATQGLGPYDEDDFDHFLEDCGIQVTDLHDSIPSAFVLGREEWEPDELEAAIEARRGRNLRVYSQEMVVASLALGADLFGV